MLGNPLLTLSEPRRQFGVFIREGETGFAVVHLFTAEALVSRHEGLAGHCATSTVDWLGVVVIRHVVLPFQGSRLLFLMLPLYIYYRQK